ncbi:LacI family DNA-binding transcriptional regulator [Streptomyces sp. GC420]|uniref:LacI family DNA-binding transcriptional regulator n=1 Tax=Streptomyces sp. GC420 TaxID=2697568 RepID=UPI0014150517|nr:LacI family DNA-binding transcriptional regulator [Streptomyces sp. GC420]NBM16855.1 substrate-binding domain-containing protein [Streptomyces sp. GC420]
MTTRRVTLADVARKAGVSRATASFVMGGRSDMRISAATQARVLRVAQDLGYRPNLTARGLRTSVTRTIGLVSDTIATAQYAGEVIHGGLDAALANDHLLLIAESAGDRHVEERLLEGMLDRQVDGIVYGAMYTRVVEPPRSLLGRPVVLLNCLAEGFPAPSVIPDEEAAGRTAAQALLDAGHRDAIYVVGGHHVTSRTPDGVFAGRERMSGIEHALRRAGVAPARVIECAWAVEQGYEEVRALLAGGHRPQAIIGCNDRVSFGACQALQEAGLDVPGDVSVVSFDDSGLASWARPQLTSIALPHYQLGRTAVELLIGGRLEPVVHRIPMPLRVRASLARRTHR